VKQGIHPDWIETNVHCICGNTWTTHSTKKELRVELCSNCHPYYTGNMRIVDTGGQVERFMKRMRARQQQPAGASSE
jgi:large subunit ribosomal protein L31